MPREPHIENLVPFSQRSKDEARENGRKGGKKSAEVRSMRKTLQWMLDTPLKPEESAQVQRNLGRRRGKLTQRDYMLMNLLSDARRGSQKAIRLVAELTGEMYNRVTVEADVNADINAVFKNQDPLSDKEMAWLNEHRDGEE